MSQRKYATAAERQRAYRDRLRRATELAEHGEFAVEYCKPRNAWECFMEGLARDVANDVASRLKALLPRGSVTRVIQIGEPLDF